MLKSFEWLAILAAVVLLLSVVGISYLSSPPSGQPHEQQATAQTENENQSEKKHSLRGFIRFMFPDAISIFTFWLTLATIGLGIVAVLQIGFLDRSERIATIAAQAAKDSADAAKKAVELSDKTAERQLRAYIVVDQGYIGQRGNKLIAFINVKNVGQTPAYDVVMFHRLDSHGANQKYSPAPLPTNPESRSIIGPGVIATVIADLDIPAGNTVLVPALKDGRAVMYAVGRVEYRDSFERTWILEFRYRSGEFDGQKWIVGPVGEGNTEAEKK